MDTFFTPETTAAATRPRRNGIGDLLNRTVGRHPDKLAVAAGERRVGYGECAVEAGR